MSDSGIVVCVGGQRYWFPCDQATYQYTLHGQVRQVMEQHGVGWMYSDGSMLAEEYRPAAPQEGEVAR